MDKVLIQFSSIEHLSHCRALHGPVREML